MDKITLEMDRRTAIVLGLVCYAAHSFRNDIKRLCEKDGNIALEYYRCFQEFHEQDANFLAHVGGKIQELLNTKTELTLPVDNYGGDEELFENLFANYTEN